MSLKEDGSTADKDSALENPAQIRKICFNYTNLDQQLKDKPKKRAFWNCRHHPETVIDLLFNGKTRTYLAEQCANEALFEKLFSLCLIELNP